MSKLANLIVANHLAHFTSIKGEVLNEVKSDIMSLLAKEETNLVSNVGDWKISEKGILSTKEGHKLALPINNSAVVLLKFGMQLSAIAKAGGLKDKPLVIDCEVPATCDAWLEQKSVRIAAKRSSTSPVLAWTVVT